MNPQYKILRAALTAKGSIVIRCTGYSMHPTLYPGDLVELTEGEIAPGDIVTFCAGSRLITHRVISLSGSTFQTRGDNQEILDQPAHISDLLGKVSQINGRPCR